MGWRCCFMMSTHSQTSTQLPEKRPRGSSIAVSSATVRVPEASPVCDHELGEEFGFFVSGHEGAGADFDVEDEGVEALGEFLAHDAGGDEEGRFDGAGVIAERVKDAVGGDDLRRLADERGAALLEDFAHVVEARVGCRSRGWSRACRACRRCGRASGRRSWGRRFRELRLEVG